MATKRANEREGETKDKEKRVEVRVKDKLSVPYLHAAMIIMPCLCQAL